MTLLHLDLVYASVGKTCCNNACTRVIKRWHTENNCHHSEINSPSPPLEADIIILTNGTRGLYQVILTSTTTCLNCCRSSIWCINASINLINTINKSLAAKPCTEEYAMQCVLTGQYSTRYFPYPYIVNLGEFQVVESKFSNRAVSFIDYV